jgi:hypothetical protein
VFVGKCVKCVRGCRNFGRSVQVGTVVNVSDRNCVLEECASWECGKSVGSELCVVEGVLCSVASGNAPFPRHLCRSGTITK